MTSAFCRSCDGALFAEPMFRLEGAPRSAQNLPIEQDLLTETGRDLEVFSCQECGLVQLVGEPVPYFREVITAAGWSEKMIAFRQGQIERLVEQFGLTGHRILEVGCGEGYCLDLIEACGASGVGLEAGDASATRGRMRGRVVVNGYLELGIVVPGGPFDAFVCINFLEHAPSPANMLRAIRDNLIPGAVGLIEVPSFEHMIERQCFYDFIPDHLSYFTEPTLRQTLERCGFEVLSCRRIWEDYDLEATVRRREPHDCKSWNDALRELVASLGTFLVTHVRNGKRVAIWGASHQALTLLALSKASAVCYVIDSAPFKQGRFTPVIHTPIRSPLALVEDPVDVVVVMAAGYTQEIVDKLRSEIKFDGDVYVLNNNIIKKIL